MDYGHSGATDIAVRSKKLALKTGDPDDMALAEAMLAASDHLLGNHLPHNYICELGLRYLASGPRFRTEQYLFHYTSFLLVGMALLCCIEACSIIAGVCEARHRGRVKIGPSGHVLPILALIVPVF